MQGYDLMSDKIVSVLDALRYSVRDASTILHQRGGAPRVGCA